MRKLYVLSLSILQTQLSVLKKANSTLLFILAALLFFTVAWFTFRDVDVSGLWREITWQGFVLNIALCIAHFISIGIIMWVGYWKHYKLRIQTLDLLMLPIMMHFFIYILPVKGGMLFQTFFSRYKYKLPLSNGFSLGISVFLVSLLLSVTIGLPLTFGLHVESLMLKLALTGMGICLFGLVMVLHFMPKQIRETKSFLNKLLVFLINVRVQLDEQIRNRSLIFGLIAAILLSVLIQALWFWQTASMLNIDSDLVSVFLVVLVLRVILLFRVLPGNVGIQELMIGAVFLSAGFSLEQGLLVALITRLISLILAATLGLAGIYSNLHYFDSSSLSELIKKVGKDQE